MDMDGPRPFKKIGIILMALPWLGGLLSCNLKVQKDPYELIYHLQSEPDTLNLLTATDAYASRINSFLFDSLIERDNETLEFKPKIAKAWEVSEDKLTYTFYLRDDVKWHDGVPFTADDVLYTFNRILDEKVDTPHLRNYYKDISKAEKIDDYTIRFTYAKPYFKALEFVGGIPILPQHIYETGEDFNSHPAGRAPVGTGPYKFKEWKTGRHLLLERNENYWDKDHFPHLNKIRFKIVPDDTIALQYLKKGELDLSSLRPIQWVRQTNDPAFNREFIRHKYFTPGYRYIGWNLRRPYFKDKKVRRALAHLINRNDIVNKLEFGLGKITTGPFWVFGYEYNQNIPAIPFDPKKAKQLLEEAGWIDRDKNGIREKDGVDFEFDFLIPSNADFYVGLASILKKNFEDAGIKINIRTMEWASFVNHLNARKFDAVSLAWSFGFDEDPYQVWHSSQAEKGSNFVGFVNEEADQILETARTIFDKDQRAQLYHRFHEIIHQEQPYAFLYSGPALVVRDKRFKNVKVYKAGLDILEWKVSKDE